MSKRWGEYAVGLGLLLGPLAYALTLSPEVVEVVEVVEATPELPQANELRPIEVEFVRPPEPIEAQPEAEPAADDRIEFAFVNSAGIVLSTEAETSWGKGRLRAHAGPGEFRAAKRAEGAEIPASHYAQRGRTFDLYGDSGLLCTVRLGELFVLAQHNGPSVYDLFEGEDGSYDWDEDKTFSRGEIRRKVWSQEYDSPWLVADVLGDPACEGALWARDHTLPPPQILHHSERSSPTTERRLAVHEASAVLAETHENYDAWYEGIDDESREYVEPWSEIAFANAATVEAWLDAQGTPRLVELNFGDAVGEWCGEGFDTRITSLDEVVGEGFEPTERAIDAITIFDADLDGHFELLYESDDGVPFMIASDTPHLAMQWYLEEGFTCPC